MKMYLSILVSLLLVLAGCVPSFKVITNPEMPFEKRHFSVRVPRGDNWRLIDETPAIVYFGNIQSKTHTITAYVEESDNFPSFASPEEFYTFLKTSLAFNNNPDRFKFVRFEASRDAKYGEYSIRYSRIFEDHKAPNAPADRLLITKVNGCYILFPGKTGLIHLFYSERGLADEMQPDYDTKADNFTKTLSLKINGKYYSDYKMISGTTDGNAIIPDCDEATGVPIDIGEDQYDKFVSGCSSPILVEFYAPWDEYCQKYKPLITEIAAEYKGKVRVVTINSEKNEYLSYKHKVRLYPTVFLIKNGKVLDTWIGIRGGKDKIKERIRDVFNII